MLPTIVTHVARSAEAVVGMMLAEMKGDESKWTVPEWLPHNYLTWNRLDL